MAGTGGCSFLAYHCLEHLEVGLEVFAEYDVGSFVGHLVTVLGSREDGDDSVSLGQLEALVLYLMGTYQ